MIFIPGNVPSSKNGKQWTGKLLIWSKAAREYRKATEWEFVQKRVAFKKLLAGQKPPYSIAFQFVRGTKHKFDYTGPLETIQDLMVKYRWLEDDNADILLPMLRSYSYDKEKPGVWIDVIQKN
jgi:hypothetical protein